jgi:peptidoglycan/xylan/chitin deacetylase (PgdA/CDA1 family)
VRRGRSAVLNLCFHGIGTPGRELEPGEDRFWIEPHVFEGMLDAVAGDAGVRITFDDGNASDVEVALPALLRRPLDATFFVIAGRCGQPGALSREDVGELARQGMTIGSHGMRHRSWPSVHGEELREELVDAPRLLADAAGRPVHEAACPFGDYDRRVLRELRRAGFARVYTVDEGAADPDAWLQTRYSVRRSDTPERIAALARDPGEGLARELARSVKQAVKRWR